jgi:hypothetical protein
VKALLGIAPSRRRTPTPAKTRAKTGGIEPGGSLFDQPADGETVTIEVDGDYTCVRTKRTSTWW